MLCYYFFNYENMLNSKFDVIYNHSTLKTM